jgi:hypothetical protein
MSVPVTAPVYADMFDECVHKLYSVQGCVSTRSVQKYACFRNTACCYHLFYFSTIAVKETLRDIEVMWDVTLSLGE